MGRGRVHGEVTEPAWKSKPSYYLVASDDRMIPPPFQHMMAKRAGAEIAEGPGSYAIYVLNAKAVADIIKNAATQAKWKLPPNTRNG